MELEVEGKLSDNVANAVPISMSKCKWVELLSV